MPIKVIAFDADDTLWVNEPFFREAEEKFASLLEDFMPQHTIMKELYRTEIENLKLYGYGIKGFMLSMIETALRVTDHKMPITIIDKVIRIGQEMLEKPVHTVRAGEDQPLIGVQLCDRIEELPDRILMYTEDGEELLERVYKKNFHPKTSLVRRSSLEDVFLRLTGRTLVD